MVGQALCSKANPLRRLIYEERGAGCRPASFRIAQPKELAHAQASNQSSDDRSGVPQGLKLLDSSTICLKTFAASATSSGDTFISNVPQSKIKFPSLVV
jgi:hypothetical protein